MTWCLDMKQLKIHLLPLSLAYKYSMSYCSLRILRVNCRWDQVYQVSKWFSFVIPNDSRVNCILIPHLATHSFSNIFLIVTFYCDIISELQTNYKTSHTYYLYLDSRMYTETHKNRYSEPFESKLQRYYASFTHKYFSMNFLNVRIFFYISTV